MHTGLAESEREKIFRENFCRSISCPDNLLTRTVPG